jgi:hypothetical protein
LGDFSTVEVVGIEPTAQAASRLSGRQPIPKSIVLVCYYAKGFP